MAGKTRNERQGARRSSRDRKGAVMLPSAEHTPPGRKIPKIFLGAGRILGRFLGGPNRIWRAPGAFRGAEKSIWGVKRPVLTRFCPGYGPKMGDNRPGFASQNPRFTDYVMERRGCLSPRNGFCLTGLAWDLRAG